MISFRFVSCASVTLPPNFMSFSRTSRIANSCGRFIMHATGQIFGCFYHSILNEYSTRSNKRGAGAWSVNVTRRCVSSSLIDALSATATPDELEKRAYSWRGSLVICHGAAGLFRDPSKGFRGYPLRRR